MSLKVDMDKYDYLEAIKIVQNLLNGIEIDTGIKDNINDLKIIGIPSATEIVDAVWDAIV